MDRVLYIIDHLQNRSGIASVAMNYYRFFQKDGFNVDFLTYDENDESLENEVRQMGGNINYIPYLSIKNFFRFFISLKAFFEKNAGQYKVVHSHFPQIDLFAIPIAKKYGGVSHYISHSHNTKHADSFLKIVRNFCFCYPLRFISDYRAACSIKAGKFMYGRGFSKSKKDIVVNNAVDCSKYIFDIEKRKELRKTLNVDDAVVVGTVGGLRIQKNYSFLIDVMKILSQTEKKYKLIIVGEGPLKENLEQKVKRNNLEENVMFLGRRSDVDELYSAMDVFVLPSIYEGLPVVGIEAQATGLQCLFSDRITREVGVVNSSFLPITDAFLWAKKIELLNSCVDRKKTASEIRTLGFDIACEAKKIQSFYKEMMK